ncbi:hypothetical protein [Tepidiphilus succinatimandens]|uniref:hypothetical protein n=1 Tax=Tepidiphilus succinatimandens TaxID=224436 RepID=UPI00112F0413|nr:hypothetical protein [Tepidiphilus succinatimandens]
MKPTIRERVLHTHWKACVEAIRDRFPALSPRLAAIVLGYAVDGRLPPAWDTEEIARKIGIPPGNFSELMPEIHRIVEKAAEKPPVNLPSTKAGSSGHRRWALALALVTLSLTGVVLADQNGAFQDGKSLGSSVNQSAFSGINSGAASDKIPGYGTNPSETQFFQGGQGQLSGPGVAKMQNCATATPDSDPIKRQECEAVNFLARNPQIRPQFNITKNDPMILAAKHARDNAEEFFKSLGINGGTGSGSQCTTRVETTPAQYSTETCSSFKEVNEQQCTMGRLVNIDTDSNFQCDQTINAYETLKCRRSSNITCTGGGDGCDRGGIIPNSWAGDMATSWFPSGGGNYILQFGTIADNYWRDGVYDRTLTFTISDLNLITVFALTRVSFDDWLLVQVNGTTVYVGPKGGDRLLIYQPAPVFESNNFNICQEVYNKHGNWACASIGAWYGENGSFDYYESCTKVSGGWNCIPYDSRTGMVQYCSNCFGYAELKTSWNFNLNIDLRPYLRNGSNTIFTRTIVGGSGENAIQITTRQKCPLQCSISTQNGCASLEARAQ